MSEARTRSKRNALAEIRENDKETDIVESNVGELCTNMDKHEILLFPSFPNASKERTRKKLWRTAVEVVASDDEDSDMDEHECAFFPAKRHCTQLSDTIVEGTRTDTVFYL